MVDEKKIAELIAHAGSDKKADEILVLELKNLTVISDYFVIMSASNTRLVQAIADNIEDELEKIGVLPLRKEGYAQGKWILLDYGVCIAHIFLQEERSFYNLEQLWANAPVITFDEKE